MGTAAAARGEGGERAETDREWHPEPSPVPAVEARSVREHVPEPSDNQKSSNGGTTFEAEHFLSFVPPVPLLLGQYQTSTTTSLHRCEWLPREWVTQQGC